MRSVRSIYGRAKGKANIQWEQNLEDSESIIINAIQNYFALMWSRHWKKFDDNRYAVRVLSMIAQEIKSGLVPRHYNFCYYVSAEVFCTNRPIPRTIIEGYFCRVADYLFEKKQQPDNIRQTEYEMMLNGKK